MALHYVTRDDKNGNKLTTSYDTKAKADKFGVGENRKEWVGVKYLNPDNEGEFTDENTNYVVRSVLRVEGDNVPQYEGQFVIYTLEGVSWTPTIHRYPTYGVANTAMKSFVGVYRDMIIVEEPKQTVKQNVALSTEDAPF